MSESELAASLFRPRAVALVGASGDERKNTARPQRYLKQHGYTGRIVPINPGRDEVLGLPAFPDVASAPGPIEHAFIMTPAATVPSVIADCARAGVTVATIFSDGFAETGADGLAAQQQIVAAARAAGIRIVGPNSMGVIDVHANVAITVNAVLEAPEIRSGPLGVISQSGTMIGALMSRGQARGVGFSRLVSIGNEADLTVGDVGDMLVDDPETGAILLFLETIRDAGSLAAMARRAFAAGKPVIAYKLGRSQAGQALSVSHSGALAGDDAAAEAFLRANGILRVDMTETLLEIPALVMGRRPQPGKRVGVLTTTGGGAATVIDRMGALGIDLIRPPDALRAQLAARDIRLGDGPLVDVTMAGARRDIYQPALEALLASADCEAVVAVVGSSAQFHPDIAVEPIVAAARTSDKPIAAFLVPQADRSLALLSDAGIAAFRTPEACADAMRAVLDWAAPAEPSEPDAERVAAARAALGAADSIDEFAARAVFGALGIAHAPGHRLDESAPASEVGYPVAAKIVSPDIAHKTESGGVMLNIEDEAALAGAPAAIRARVAAAEPGARITGVLVQRMVEGIAEVLIGYRVAPDIGPIVTVAPGGVLAEIYRDASVRLAPVDLATAQAMIEEVRGLAPIRGYRGLPKGDCAALAQAIVALSALARVSEVAEAEINPLVVGADGAGAIAVDGLIVTRNPEA